MTDKLVERLRARAFTQATRCGGWGYYTNADAVLDSDAASALERLEDNGARHAGSTKAENGGLADKNGRISAGLGVDPNALESLTPSHKCPTCGQRVEYRLCYVEGGWAYFTCLPLNEQWGDDWDDAPYEHNAGTPYNRETAQIVKLAWEGPFDTPDAGVSNSPWSVQDINGGRVPWLKPTKWSPAARRDIWAGATVRQFITVMQEGGGTAYAPCDSGSRPEGEDAAGG